MKKLLLLLCLYMHLIYATDAKPTCTAQTSSTQNNKPKHAEDIVAAYKRGYSQGKDEGFLDGYQQGSEEGYGRGYADGFAERGVVTRYRENKDNNPLFKDEKFKD